MKDAIFDYRAEYIAITNEIFRRKRAGEEMDPLLLRADELLEKYADYLQAAFYVCICSLCGAEYWCKDVGAYCPTCGANVPESDSLNWSIYSANTEREWAKHVESEYKRRGDRPLMPKGTDMELLQKELRGYRKVLYEWISEDHPRFKELEQEYLYKIKKIRWQMRELKAEQVTIGPGIDLGNGLTSFPIKFNYRNTRAWKGK